MSYIKDGYKLLLGFIVFTLLSFFLAYTYINTKEKILLKEAYQFLSMDIKNGLNTLINNKKNATMAIALPVSKDFTLINSFLNNDFHHFDFKHLSKELRENTNYKNVWIQIIDKNGFSKYRSWTKNKNDEIKKIRTDLNKTFELRVPRKVISLGAYDLTFKATVPIIIEDKFYGVIEAITKFNSISTSLKKIGFNAVVLANKDDRYKLKYPFSKEFIDDYYVSNVNVNKDILRYLRKNDIEEYLKINDYLIKDGFFITNVKIENSVGNILLFKELDKIDLKSIDDFKKQSFILLFIGFLILTFIFVTYFYQTHTKNVNKLNKRLIKGVRKLRVQRNKTQQLLDSQLNIIVITDGEEILNANRQLLNFFTDCKNLHKFKEKYTCVCTAFVPFGEDENYVLEKDYDGLNWAEYILSNPRRHFKAAMYNMNDELRHFKVNVSQNDEDSFIIVTLTDITHDIHAQEKLKEFNTNLEKLVDEKTHQLQDLNESLEIRIEKELENSKKKDRVIFQQNKMASIAQMLHNIAHQWRQPLNAISTSASAMLINKEMGLMDDKNFKESCTLIVDKSKYLSNIIENFRDFFTVDNSLELRSIKEVVNQSLSYVNIILEEKSIDIKVDYFEDVTVAINENEFKQAFLKILDNSIESLEKHTQADDRIILINLKDNKLTIQDSGCGISDEIVDRVFEPYFTTKHQSQGVGLGLYMVQEILSKQMNFKLEIKNEEFKYNNKTQKGLEFIIDLK